MKKINLLLALSFLLVSLFSCSKDEANLDKKDENHSTTSISSVANVNDDDLDYFPFKFPHGTTVIEGDNKISFELPDGYLAYGFSGNNSFTSFNKGSVTCSCSSGSGGCSPGKIGDTVACVMTTCSSCTKSGSSYFESNQFREVAIFNMNEPIAFFSNVTELNGKIMLPPQYYDLDIIKDRLIELEENLLPAETSETKIVPISLYGYVVLIEVAMNVDTTSPYMMASSVKCGCNSGGSCPKDSKLIAVWCDASNCKSCTMNTSIIDFATNKEYRLVATTHSISIY